MSDDLCSCAKLERLAGASVPAYTKAFLDEIEKDEKTGTKRFRCRVCGRMWEKQAGEVEGTRPTLVRVV